MQKQLMIRWVAISLAAGTLAASAAPGRQRYRLHGSPAAGDVYVFDQTMDMSMSIQVKADGRVIGQLDSTCRSRERYREQVLTAGPDGPAALKREYTLDRTVDASPEGKTTKVTSLEGKTVQLSRSGKKATITASPGNLAADDRKALLKEAGEADLDYMPDHEVAPGDEWIVDPKLALRALKAMDTAEIKCRLLDIVQFAGHPCARVGLSMHLAGHLDCSTDRISTNVTGYAYQLVDLKRPLGIEFTGPTWQSSIFTKNGKTGSLSGQGTIHVKETRHWLKVNGKPVPAKA